MATPDPAVIHHSSLESGSFWAMLSAIAAVIVNQVVLGAETAVVKLATLGILAAVGGTATAGYTGAITSARGRFANWRVNRRIRRHPELVRRLRKAVTDADRHLGSAGSFTDSFQWVLSNTILERMRNSPGAKPDPLNRVEGAVYTVQVMARPWDTLKQELLWTLDSTAGLNTSVYYEALRTVGAYLTALSSFARYVATTARQSGVTWSEDALEAWDGSRQSVNALLRDFARLVDESASILEITPLGTWLPSVPAILTLPEPAEPDAPPKGASSTP